MPRGPIELIAALDPKPWGGRALEQFGFALPPGVLIGEAHLAGADAVVRSGPLAGRTLAELMAADPDWLAGERGRAATGGLPLFPLLIKLIDAREALSVQVHPDDAAARPLGGVGKTEAWHILAAESGSLLYLGLDDPDGLAELARRSRAGERTGDLLRAHAPVPGETLLLPAGTIHAIGAGLLIYEIQQPSGVTYRFDDWGRLGSDGRPRELHIEESLAVAKAELQPAPIPPVKRAPGRTLLVTSDYFSLERIELAASESATLDYPGSPAVITLLAGSGTVEAAGVSIAVTAGETVVIPPGDLPGTLIATGSAVAFYGWV
ncbi:MAG: class I mannose-6-phosphate isomerase [Thermomicrobiales bacterium]|nr:class I mannose-6-phosphate isomerase [Thermomicrobiales bacterium]